MADEETLLIGDLNAINEQLAQLTDAITAGNATDIAAFFRDLVIRLKLQERQMEEFKRYVPRIYTQIHTNTYNTFEDGVFDINFGTYSTIYPQLMLMIPKEASIVYAPEAETPTKNILRFRQIVDGAYTNVITFDIYKESNTGAMVPATTGDIVPNRSVLFRFLYGQFSTPRAIILNTSGLFNESVSNLYVTSEAVFGEAPSVVNYSTEAAVHLATMTDVAAVETKIDAFIARFKFVEGDAKTVADASSDGTIVFEIDHD